MFLIYWNGQFGRTAANIIGSAKIENYIASVDKFFVDKLFKPEFTDRGSRLWKCIQELPGQPAKERGQWRKGTQKIIKKATMGLKIPRKFARGIANMFCGYDSI